MKIYTISLKNTRIKFFMVLIKMLFECEVDRPSFETQDKADRRSRPKLSLKIIQYISKDISFI
jgi:hypothetical protein